MLIVTTENIPGYEIKEVKGEVFGVVVRSRGAIGNLAAGLRSIFGGEVLEYTSLLEESRLHAIEKMRTIAAAKGANAIVMFRFDSSEIGDVMTEVVAYGTAVFIEKLK
jgi:uncharacterized protein YbjQ (UPF0145 family)